MCTHTWLFCWEFKLKRKLSAFCLGKPPVSSAAPAERRSPAAFARCVYRAVARAPARGCRRCRLAGSGRAAGTGGMTACDRARFHQAPRTRRQLLLLQRCPAPSPASCLVQSTERMQKSFLTKLRCSPDVQPFELGEEDQPHADAHK